MDFSLTTVFVVPVGNTLPTAGSTENLTDGQVGVFKDNARTVATAGNSSTAKFIQIGQGRPNTLYLGTKLSDRIKSTKVKKWYKIAGQATASVQITKISAFAAKCDEDVTLTLRGHSSYADTISFNGITRSVTVPMPCCDCGADPCAEIANETIIDLLLAKINTDDLAQKDPGALKLTSFWSFSKEGTGTSAVLVITGKALTVYGNACDIAAFPWEYDRFWFNTYVYKGPDTSVDFIVFDSCDNVATVTVTQRSSFPLGTSAQVKQEEIDYYSYQSWIKDLFRMTGYNQLFTSWVTDGTLYDEYVIQFDEAFQDDSYTANIKEDERVLIFVPTAQSAAIEAILVPYLGAVEVDTYTVPTTTTSTTTSSTTSTTTTTLTP